VSVGVLSTMANEMVASGFIKSSPLIPVTGGLSRSYT
jgi:hypothetical protein